jgi:CBS domain-containing protein
VKRLTVRDFLDSLPHRVELPVVKTESPLREVLQAMVKRHRGRIVYVVDLDGKIKGSISLDNLKDVIFRHYLKSRVSDPLVITEHIVELFTSEKAEDVMDAGLSFCYEHERLHDVVTRMIERNVKDMPVVDQEGRIIADLDILDLLELWLEKGEKAFQ